MIFLITFASIKPKIICQTLTHTMAIQHYIKEIGRGARGAKALDRAQAADLLGQILDGQVSDYEVGAFCIAMRIKGETAEEMCGLWDAVHARMARFDAQGSQSPDGGTPAIIIPSYKGARRLPTLTPLLAMLLARESLPVVVHGMQTEASRTSVFAVLQRLGIAPHPQVGTLARRGRCICLPAHSAGRAARGQRGAGADADRESIPQGLAAIPAGLAAHAALAAQPSRAQSPGALARGCGPTSYIIDSNKRFTDKRYSPFIAPNLPAR